MIVLVLSACPPGLRGYLSRWLLEISAGVFVGRVSRRLRESLWERTIEMTRTGRAILVYQARNEQGLAFLTHGHHWEPIDMDGISLMLRPATPARRSRDAASSEPSAPSTGWSKAARSRARRRG